MPEGVLYCSRYAMFMHFDCFLPASAFLMLLHLRLLFFFALNYGNTLSRVAIQTRLAFDATKKILRCFTVCAVVLAQLI